MVLLQVNLTVSLQTYNLVLGTSNCISKTFPGPDINLVCVCNSTYCDTVEGVDILSGNIYVYESTLNGKRLEFRKTPSNLFETTLNITININQSKQFQKIFGFGGAFTDAVGINLLKLSNSTQKRLLYSYFNPQGKL